MARESHKIWGEKQVPHTESAVFFEENILAQIGIGNQKKILYQILIIN